MLLNRRLTTANAKSDDDDDDHCACCYVLYLGDEAKRRAHLASDGHRLQEQRYKLFRELTFLSNQQPNDTDDNKEQSSSSSSVCLVADRLARPKPSDRPMAVEPSEPSVDHNKTGELTSSSSSSGGIDSTLFVLVSDNKGKFESYKYVEQPDCDDELSSRPTSQETKAVDVIDAQLRQQIDYICRLFDRINDKYTASLPLGPSFSFASSS